MQQPNQSPETKKKFENLICEAHREKVHAICRYTDCKYRVLCRGCFIFHNQQHLDQLFFLEDFTSNNILKHFDIQLHLNNKIDQHELLNIVIDKLDHYFKDMENYFISFVKETKQVCIQSLFMTYEEQTAYISTYNQLKANLENTYNEVANNFSNEMFEQFVKHHNHFEKIYAEKAHETIQKMNALIIKVEDCEKTIEDLKMTTIKNLEIFRTKHDSGIFTNKLKLAANLNTNNLYINHGCLAYLKYRNQIATTGKDGKINIFNLTEFKKAHSINASNSPINKLLYIPEKQYLFAAGEDRAIKMWGMNQDPESKLTELFLLKDYHSGSIYTMAYSKKNDCLYSGGTDLFILIWKFDDSNYSTNKIVTCETECGVGSLMCIMQDNWLVSGMKSGDIILFYHDITLNKLLEKSRVKSAHNNWILSLDYCENDKLLISGGNDGVIKLWKLIELENEINSMGQTNHTISIELIWRYQATDRSIRSLIGLMSIKLIIYMSDDNKMRVVEVGKNNIVREFQGNKTAGNALLLIEDNKLILSAFEDNLCIWSYDYLRELR